jgi:nitrite reductase/ring-hydroxylating ferredoxin subunit
MDVCIGFVDELVAGEVRRASLGVDAEGRPFQVMVLRDADGRIVAYRNLCQHLPVPLDGGTGELLTDDGAHLICGTHGALYRLGDGLCVEGPCEGASLEPLPVRVEGGRVYVGREPR